MATRTVLRLRRTDNKSEHVLVSITRKDPRNLHLELVGTDQETIYHGSITEASVQHLKTSSFDASAQEWRDVLAYALLHQRPSGPLPESLKGVEAVSTVANSTVTITLRKNIGGAVQKLGVIKLEQHDQDIDTLEWVAVAVIDAENLRTEHAQLQSTVSSQEERIAQLKTQLDQLVKARKEHDEELVSKCAALLNAKKRKIRDQARLLSGSHFDQGAKNATSIPQPLKGSSQRQAGSSRDGKRKATSNAVDADADMKDVDDDTSNDGQSDDADERIRQETPDADSDEADLTGDDFNDPRDDTGSTDMLQGARTIETHANPSRRPASPGASAAAAANEDDDDEETEDEL